MNKNWVTHVHVRNVEFRILISGKNASAYEKDWKSAHVSFSSNDHRSQHIMTVEYKYGKKIDIVLGDEMSRFQVQQEVGRVTIVSEKRHSTFCIKNVAKKPASQINFFLKVIASRSKDHLNGQEPIQTSETASLQDPIDQNKQNPQLRSPLQNLSTTKPRLCYSDSKRKQKSTDALGGKRLRASLSPDMFLCHANYDEKASLQKSNNTVKKFQDFRKAKADLRQDRLACSTDVEDAKENTSPRSLERIKIAGGLGRSSFYGLKSEPSFLSEVKNYTISRTPSPIKRSPKSFSTMNTPNHSTGSVIRALLNSDKKTAEDENEDLGVKRLTDSSSSENNNDDVLPKSAPLVDKINLISSHAGEGFQNLGNTCYMNSTLQSLFGLVPFQKDLEQLRGKMKDLVKSDSVIMTVTELMQHKSASSSTKASLLRSVKQAIGSNAKQFYGFAQQDAHEFLRLCLDLLQEEVLEASKKRTSTISDDEDDETDKTSVDKLTCPVTANFSFTVKNEITCTNCNAVTSKEDELYDLPVEISAKGKWFDPVCLQRLVNRTFAVEHLEYLCEKCNHQKATARKVLTKLPRIMMIYLKRYCYNSTFEKSEKLEQCVSIPRYITFQKHASDDVAFIPSTNHSFPFVTDHRKEVENPFDVADQDLRQLFDCNDNFDDIKTCNISTPFTLRTLPDANNNNNNTRNDNSSAAGIDPSIYLPDSDSGKASPDGVLDYFDKNSLELPDPEKLQSMSEAEQIELAIRLSMQDDPSQSKVNVSSSSSLDVLLDESHLITTANSSPLSGCAMAPHSDSTASLDGTGDELASASRKSVPQIAESPSKPIRPSTSTFTSALRDLEKEATVEERSRSGATSLGLDVGDSGFPVLLQPRTSCSTENNNNGLSKSAADEEFPEVIVDDDEESNELFKNQSTGQLPHSYHIVSIVSHKGGSSKFGHYVSDVLTDYSGNRWQCYDDDHVEPVSEDHVLLGRQSSCYLLFYVHK